LMKKGNEMEKRKVDKKTSYFARWDGIEMLI